MSSQNVVLSDAPRSVQLPSSLVTPEFGEVNVRKTDQEAQVEFTILMEPQGKFAEGWRTGIALDASASMKRAYGRKVEGRVDPKELTRYIRQGLLKASIEDGESIRRIQPAAYADIQQKGYFFTPTPNILQPLVQKFAAYLANTLDGMGRTALIYWGCGKGDELQVLGEFSAQECETLKIEGPQAANLGKATKLTPAIAYFAERAIKVKRGMYVFITDGRIDDLPAVKQYTAKLAAEIAEGKRNYLKFVLIGVGDGVDRYQLQELDDFDAGTGIDLWDYKVADEMRGLAQIFAEVIDENQVVAEKGAIYDAYGNCVKQYTNGLPAKARFVMPADSAWFELEVNNRRIRQDIPPDLATSIAPLPKPPEIELSELSEDWRAGCLKIFGIFLIVAALGSAIAYAWYLAGKEVEQEPTADSPTTPIASPIGNPVPAPPHPTGNAKPPNSSNKPGSNPSNNPKPSPNQTPNQSKPPNYGVPMMGQPFLSSIPPHPVTPSPAATTPTTAAPTARQGGFIPHIGGAATQVPNLSPTQPPNRSETGQSGQPDRGNPQIGAIAGQPSTAIPSVPRKLPPQFGATSGQPVPNSGQPRVATPQQPQPVPSPVAVQPYQGNVPPVLRSTVGQEGQPPRHVTPAVTPLNPAFNLQGSGQPVISPIVGVASKSPQITSAGQVNSSPSPADPPNSVINPVKPQNPPSPAASAPQPPSITGQAQGDRANSPAWFLDVPDAQVVVYFPFDSDKLNVYESGRLQKFWDAVKTKKGTISVVGHTDALGTNTYNIELSKSRAHEVVRILKDIGMGDNYRVSFGAAAAAKPLLDNTTDEGRAYNRRVVVSFKEQK